MCLFSEFQETEGQSQEFMRLTLIFVNHYSHEICMCALLCALSTLAWDFYFPENMKVNVHCVV